MAIFVPPATPPLNNAYGSWITFRNIRLPAGATVNSAYLIFTSKSGTSIALNLQITAHLHTNSIVNPGDDTGNIFPNNLTIWPRTTACVLWNPGSWTYGEMYKSEDVSSIIEEVIGLPGWNTGNAIKFFIDDRNSGGNWPAPRREVSSYEDYSSPPALQITSWTP